VDHFHHDTITAKDQHDVILVSRPGPLRPDVRPIFAGDGVLAFPRSVGHSLGNNNPLLAPIVRASETAYTYNPRDDSGTVEEGFTTGTQLAIVSAIQARNSARFTVLGSAESLEDKWFSAEVKGPDDKKQVATSNRDFAKQLSAWTFKETGVVKVNSIQHYLTDEYGDIIGDVNPAIYRIKNDVAFNIEVSEYDYDRWVPFEVPEGDALQLEFTMLSPFHRLNLKPVGRAANSTVFSTRFTTPDQHGIFSFRVNYKRPFLTNIEEKHEVTVRHFAHDEYPRSWKISGAYPWISGLWVVILGFLGFVFIWLYSEPDSAAKMKLKKVQ